MRYKCNTYKFCSKDYQVCQTSSESICLLQVTGNLVRSRIGIKPDIVHDLPMNIPCTVNGVEVILLEANQ